jgi:tetratricopeptide (TPR) repeat protein
MRFPKTLTFFILTMGLVFTLPAWAQQKPMTQDQVQALVRDGFGDESGAKLIEQRGINFAPTEDFLQSLSTAGASEVFRNALRAAKPSESVSAKKPLDQVQIILLLAGQVPSHRMAVLVKERGIDFDVKDDYLKEVRLGGGDDQLINALSTAMVTKPEHIDPALKARQEEIRQHVARGAELVAKGQNVEAEREFRGALLFDPENDGLYSILAFVLNNQKRWDDAAAAARQALRLNPNNDSAHVSLGDALNNKGDGDGAIAEYREAVRLNGNLWSTHYSLGTVLGEKGDWDSAIAEYREALRLNPIANLARFFLGNALEKKGDIDGAIVEYREALRLDPNDDLLHLSLGVALGKKGNWLGMISEEREALRLNPNNDYAHFLLGFALEPIGDRRGALEEYRAACMLNPKDALYKQNYERLLQQVNR